MTAVIPIAKRNRASRAMANPRQPAHVPSLTGIAAVLLTLPAENQNCGDGTVQNGETCDDGNTNSGDGCSGDCSTVEPGYNCASPGSPCTSSTLFWAHGQVVLTGPFSACGDGVRAVGSEACDDGNTVPNDGCSANCLTIESGFNCPPAGGACSSGEYPAELAAVLVD